MGNIAMMPDSRVPTEIGLMEAYLIEAHSIGGISGSPVFARRTMTLLWNDEISGPARTFHGLTGEIHLIGMMHGHWDVKESEINQVRLGHDRTGVNLGIAIMVPISKILETIHQPLLAELRREEEEEYLHRHAPTMD
jgi:hypothetical protein